MSDESDDPIGFIASANEISFSLECESDLRYPVNLDHSGIPIIAPSAASHQSNFSHQSYQSEVIVPSPPRKPKQKLKPNSKTPKKIKQKQKQKQIISQMPVHHSPSNKVMLMHPKSQNHIHHNHHHHQVSPQRMVSNQRMVHPQPGSKEYDQYLYNYHYHYYQGLVDFHRSLRK